MKSYVDFIKDLRSNEELKARFTSLINGSDDKNEQEKIDLAVQFANENGYDVSVEDFTRFISEKQSLDEGELNLIYGGVQQDCTFDYECLAMWNTCVVSNECTASGRCSSSVERVDCPSLDIGPKCPWNYD